MRRTWTVLSNQIDGYVDVAARGLRIGAHLVCSVHQCLSDLAIDTWQAAIEPSPKDVTTVVGAQVHLGVDGPVTRKGNFPLGGSQGDRAQKARRPAGGEQLLGVGACSCSARG